MPLSVGINIPPIDAALNSGAVRDLFENGRLCVDHKGFDFGISGKIREFHLRSGKNLTHTKIQTDLNIA